MDDQEPLHDLACWSDDEQDLKKWAKQHDEFLKAYCTTTVKALNENDNLQRKQD